MIITSENAKTLNSFKLAYSRGLPSYKAPKIFNNKKTEEYFIATLYAQVLLYNKVPIIGVEVCEDDSNKGADAIIKIMDIAPKEIQVTRFTLTEYLKRRNIAEKKVEKLIDEILRLKKVELPVNITLHTHPNVKIPFSNKKIEHSFAVLISTLISNNYAELQSSNNFINCPVTDERLKSFAQVITLQSIPKDFNSNFFGRDNIYIDLDFDNISFSKTDIDKECLNIYTKKNGGKASILLIWADTFEILYDPKYIIEKLISQFENTSFSEVYFYNFYNRLDIFLSQEIGIAKIK